MSGERGPGRPSVADERSEAILAAYIELVAETSNPGVSVREIAERAGVSRTAVAHFVGSRDELVADTITELARRYEVELRELVGPEPTVDDLLDALFGEGWVAERSVDDRAFDILGQLADGHPTARRAVRDVYRRLVEELTGAVCRDHPDVDDGHARGAAYAITCLAEFHPFLHHLGVDAGSPNAPRSAADAIVATLLITPGVRPGT